MKQQKDFYEKPKLTEVEFDFNEAVCSVMPLSACVRSERGSTNTIVSVDGGDLNWTDYDEVTSSRPKRGRGF